MYPKLVDELKRKNIKRADIAKLLNYSVANVSKKMTGYSKFSLDDAIKIKKHFGIDIAIEILFAKDK